MTCFLTQKLLIFFPVSQLKATRLCKHSGKSLFYCKYCICFTFIDLSLASHEYILNHKTLMWVIF